MTSHVYQISMISCYEIFMKMLFFLLQLIRENINKQKTISTKSCEVDLVTETDQMVEKLLINGISTKYPDHK